MKKSRCFKNKAYLNFIRQQDCIIEGHNQGVVAHHVRLNHWGMGIKPSDYRTIPITQMQHQKLHNQGESSFFIANKKDPNLIIMIKMFEYLLTKADIEEDLLKDFEGLLEKYTNQNDQI